MREMKDKSLELIKRIGNQKAGRVANKRELKG